MKSDLFVCHASEDGASIAKHLVAKLEGHGLRCWIAPRDIAPGSSWQNAIVAAIEASRAVLLVITPCSNSSPEVEKEITLAAHLNKVIFPVRAAEVALSGALLYQIQGRQWRDLFGNNEQVVEEIAEQIAELRDGHGAVDSQKIAKINVPLNLKQSSGNSVKPRAQRFMSADGGRPSIAVLPFKNMTGDPTQEYFADGLVEDIISALSRIHSIVVIARSSSFTYKGRSVGSQQVGRELGVRYALEGSVRKSADRIRVTGHLDDTETTGQIWAGRFDGQVTDIFELQDQITASVVGALDVELKTAEIKRQKQHPTDNLTAYDHFLRGLSAFYEHTAESTCEALRQFYKVIDLDPTCATAYGYAATTLIIRRTQGWLSDRDLPEAANECLRLTGEAASRGFDDAEALSLAALVQVCLGFEVAASVELAERSLVLNPNSAWGWYAAGLAKISLGDFDGALEFVGRSIRLNPRDPSGYAHHTSYGLAQFLSNNFVEAIKASEKALVINSSCLPALRIKAASLAMLNRQTEAKTVLDKVKLLHPEVNASIVTKTMIPLRQEDLKFYADALRKAGMS